LARKRETGLETREVFADLILFCVSQIQKYDTQTILCCTGETQENRRTEKQINRGTEQPINGTTEEPQKGQADKQREWEVEFGR
jgi:hypothetical protein